MDGEKPCDKYAYALRCRCLGPDGTCYGPFYTSMDKAHLKHRLRVEDFGPCEWLEVAREFYAEWLAKRGR